VAAGLIVQLMCATQPLASFRPGAHDLDVVTAKFQSRSAVGDTASTARAARLCPFCQQGVGDEMHMLAEREAYGAVRRSHADLFCGLGW
jgi:aminoglycoside phosphotransferase family enzyme